ncbi:hypothetical protein [Streptomyces sp. NPDC057280]|uniref:hypothetical protein n=1 Tax=Streptomyces sp. NPDC057280 TaxID=3346081 RepID=UPI0036281A53
MSRIAEVIVLALGNSGQVMEPLLEYDDERSWKGKFVPVPSSLGAGTMYSWASEFVRVGSRTGLLKHLESLPWDRPESVQVLIHDEEDDCFGLWMIHDGKLVEIELPRTVRLHDPAPETFEFAPSPGYLVRTDQHGEGWRSHQTPEHLRDPRPAW